MQNTLSAILPSHCNASNQLFPTLADTHRFLNAADALLYLSYGHVEVFAAFPARIVTSRACEHVVTPTQLLAPTPDSTGMTTNQSHHTHMVDVASLRSFLPIPLRSAFSSRTEHVASLLCTLLINDVRTPQIGRQGACTSESPTRHPRFQPSRPRGIVCTSSIVHVA